MYPHKDKPSILPASLILILLVLMAISFSTSLRAQTPGSVSGELMAAKGASINGAGAVSGQTVFSNNRVRTGRQGQAVISLGRRGRLEIGAETDLTMKLFQTNIGGEIKSGSLKLSAPSGISVSVMTPKGLVTTDGKQGSIIYIEIAKETTRVTSLLGESRIVSGERNERLITGEEISISQSDWKRRYLTSGILASGGALAAASTLGNAAQTAANAAPQAVNGSRTAVAFADLLNNSVNFTLNRLGGSNRGIDENRFFDTTITCRDHDNVACRRRSGTKP